MRKIFSSAMIGGLLFAGCNNSDSSTNNISFDSSIVTQPKAVTQITDSSTAVQNTIQTLPAPTTTPATTVSTNTTTATTAPGMNPPHGQPGHRCDIAVGAPLNSPPGKAVTAPATQPVVTSTTTTPPVKTAPGMNPPHGQPGHRCDIAVGAPLNSAPVKAITTKTAADTKAAETVPASISTDTTKKQ